MIKRWCIYLTTLLGCLVLYAVNQGWFAWILLLSVLWLPVLSLVLSLPAILSVQVQVKTGGVVYAGEVVPLVICVKCPLPVPECRCKVRVTRRTTNQSVLLQHNDNLPTEHCGNLQCEPKRCWVFDYLCLFRFPIHKASGSSVTVRPVPVPLPLLGELDALQARAWQPKPGGGFAENHELRLFRPGDSMNQVHWKLSAKTGKLTVREAMEPSRGRIMLTMELRGSAEELDLKLGKFYWLSQRLLQKGMHHELHTLTGEGLLQEKITSEQDMHKTIDLLLDAPTTTSDEKVAPTQWVIWHYHIGGEPDEA